MNAPSFEILSRIRKHHNLDSSAQVGVIGCFPSGKDAATGQDMMTCTTPGQDSVIRIVATTDNVDLVGEVVDPKGADLQYVNQRGQNKAFADHRYATEFVVGRIRYLNYWPNAKTPRGLVASIAMLRGKPIADDCWRIAKEMGIGASIGFEAKEVTAPRDGDPDWYKSADAVIRKWKLLEISLTCLPCNVACQSEGVASPDDSKMALLDELVCKNVIRRETAMALGLDTRKSAPRIRLVSGV